MVRSLGLQLWKRQTYCRYEANLAPRDQEKVATIVWKTLLHTQLPRDCWDGGGGTVGAMLARAENQVMRAGMPRRCPGSLKSVHGCLSVPAATTGCRHCPAKGAGVSGFGVSFTGSCTDSVLPGPGHPREAQSTMGPAICRSCSQQPAPGSEA